MSYNKLQILSLYKCLLREASKFPSYNFRNYALRRIRDNFKENKKLADSHSIQFYFAEGKRNLEVLRRQVAIAYMYSTEKLVIEDVKADN